MRLKYGPSAIATGLALAIGLPSAGLAGEATPPLTARDAGARYGQALGALEICYGSKLTDKGKALAEIYKGTEQGDFKAQAAKVFASWSAVKNCANQRDPNQCKIIMDKSCALADAEIGSAGTVLPGLVEFLRP